MQNKLSETENAAYMLYLYIYMCKYIFKRSDLIEKTSSDLRQ